jgi:transcription initiation factor TFIID subunit 2
VIKSVKANGIDSKFRHLEFLDEVVPADCSYRDMEAFDLHFRSRLGAAEEGELTIDLPQLQELQKISEREVNVEIEFELVDPVAGAFFMLPDANNPNRVPHMYTFHPPYGGCADGARTWFPCVDRLSVRCPFSLEITVAAEHMAISAGQLLRQVLSSDQQHKTFYYQTEIATSAAHISLAVGPFSVFANPEIPSVTHFCLPGDEHKVWG